MRRIYLDQNHWVSLTKARVGHEGGDKFTDVLLLAREAVERGWVSFPLSQEHVMELWHRSDYQSRIELGVTMAELSRWHTIAQQRKLVGAEIDRALHQEFGRPVVPRRAQVFGKGLDHALGKAIKGYEPPPGMEIPDELRAPLLHWLGELKQMAAFLGAPPEFEAPGYDPTAHRRVSESFAEEQERLRSIRREHGFHHGDRGRRATSVDVFSEFERAFTEALELAGLHWGHVYALERKGMERLLRSAPTVFAHLELRRFRHEASPKPWEAGDLADLVALSSAVVYCDVVVTERVWTHIVKRTKLRERFNTVVLRDLRELVPQLLSAAREEAA